ncbi:MAG TPA: hypothetical protein VIB48_24005 [Acidimicrobiia bacterium]
MANERDRLPPGVGRDAPDVDTDPRAAEARGRAMMAQAGDAIIEGVARELPGWAVREVLRLLDAWGTDPDTRRRAEAEAAPAGREAAERVVAELRALFARDAEEQRATPLQIVRTAYREPTDVLERAGVPAVVRDSFEEQALPGDRYGLAPRSLGDLGDEDLSPLLLAWGIGKATVVRARRRP